MKIDPGDSDHRDREIGSQAAGFDAPAPRPGAGSCEGGGKALCPVIDLMLCVLPSGIAGPDSAMRAVSSEGEAVATVILIDTVAMQPACRALSSVTAVRSLAGAERAAGPEPKSSNIPYDRSSYCR